MIQFAEFTPIVNELPQRGADYYTENNIQPPNNRYFNNFFPMYQEPIQGSDIVSEQNSFYAPRFFGREADTKYTAESAGSVGTPRINGSKGSITIGAKDSLAFKNNNPGNLRLAGQKGAVEGEGGFAKFNSPEEGFNAVVDDIISKQTGKTRTGLTGNSTLRDYISVYAPPSENNTDNYVAIVTDSLKLPGSTKLKDIDPVALAKIIVHQESTTTVN